MTGEELRQIMWGRESFSTPVRISPNVVNTQVSAVTAGFGDALTAALDVMAFAHDLDLTTATDGIPGNVDGKQQVKVQPNVVNDPKKGSTNVQTNSRVELVEPSKFAGLADIIEKPVESTNLRPAVEPSEEEDPFLELVVASETTSDQDVLLKLAKAALAFAEKSTTTQQLLNPHVLENFGMIGIPKTFEKRVVKKQYFVESSDNDLCANENTLGAEAYLRRIRSANNRFMKNRKKSGRTGDDSSSSSSSRSFVDENIIGYRSLLNGPEEEPAKRTQNEGREKSVETIKDEVRQNGTRNSDKPQKRRPKTARNRVSPEEEPASRRESIERNKVPLETTTTTTTTKTTTTTTTDPLEPWSTRGIKDMNAILAWKENALDSP